MFNETRVPPPLPGFIGFNSNGTLETEVKAIQSIEKEDKRSRFSENRSTDCQACVQLLSYWVKKL